MCYLKKTKNIIMCYSMLLERWEETEAIDILHFKIGRGMKKLLIFTGLSSRHVAIALTMSKR